MTSWAFPKLSAQFPGRRGRAIRVRGNYHSLKAEWEKLDDFVDSDSGLREHEDIYKEYFGTVVPSTDNVFAALNSAVWSGGSFIYVPKGVKIEFPLQAYFRINSQNMGQFERTLIIVDEGATVHYVEGCTAPRYSEDTLHSGVLRLLFARTLVAVIRPSRTGRATSTIWSPSGRWRPTASRWSGWTPIWVRR